MLSPALVLDSSRGKPAKPRKTQNCQTTRKYPETAGTRTENRHRRRPEDRQSDMAAAPRGPDLAGVGGALLLLAAAALFLPAAEPSCPRGTPSPSPPPPFPEASRLAAWVHRTSQDRTSRRESAVVRIYSNWIRGSSLRIRD